MVYDDQLLHRRLDEIDDTVRYNELFVRIDDVDEALLLILLDEPAEIDVLDEIGELHEELDDEVEQVVSDEMVVNQIQITDEYDELDYVDIDEVDDECLVELELTDDEMLDHDFDLQRIHQVDAQQLIIDEVEEVDIMLLDEHDVND